MSLWDRFIDWLERKVERNPPPLEVPEYDRPYVRRSSAEEQRRAEEAVRTLEAYVRAQRGERRDGPRR